MKTILLDGFLGNHSRLERMCRNLVATNVSSWGLDHPRTHVRGHIDASIWRYDTSGGNGLEELGGQLIGHLRSLDKPFHIVAYSMGGLVLREALRQAPDLPLSRAVFLHTPHRGTWMGHLLGLPAVRQMRPGSAFLKRLDEAPWNVPTLNVWCPGDLIVVPGWNARWTRATREICCHIPAHVWPLRSHGLHRSIGNFLACDGVGGSPALIPSPERRTTNQEQAT